MALSRKEKEQLSRKQYMIDATRTLFAEKGYEHTSMNEIAEKAEFSKRTIYQYFQDKAELYLVVIIQEYRQLYDYLSTYNYSEGINGYEKMSQLINAYYDYYKANRKTYYFLYDVGKIKTLSDSPQLESLFEVENQLTNLITEVIILGQKDHSIHISSDVYSLSCNFKFMVTSLFNQLATAGDNYAQHIGKEPDQFAKEMIGLLLQTLN
ncbi:MAG: TetR/AcrR family transcriptional regulator [Spirochaetales bacterium]|nr:TetR/AcrR family transcriptional regulator [Spirochaetales bacterium]